MPVLLSLVFWSASFLDFLSTSLAVNASMDLMVLMGLSAA
jgi:hypothetical protein